MSINLFINLYVTISILGTFLEPVGPQFVRFSLTQPADRSPAERHFPSAQAPLPALRFSLDSVPPQRLAFP
jgi:hypothetical protein